MKKYTVDLKAEVSQSFHATLAAQSLDINTAEKSQHHFEVDADLDSPFAIGLIVGASGSGKSSLARKVYGEFTTLLDKSKCVIDQFPSDWTYDQRAAALTGIGLTAVPCWIKPAGTLSNGQQARAEAALQLANSGDQPTVIDEWTSVVDRTVAKAMSNCVQKFARRTKKSIVLISCHYDVIEWLDPDWVIDCNSQSFIDRRSLRQKDRVRKERLFFEVREVDKSAWAGLSKYHYLSKDLANGRAYYFGLFSNDDLIGFLAFTNYTPRVKGKKMVMHFNRLVIHPDYVGLSLGIKFLDICTAEMVDRGYRVMGKFSSTPVFKALSKSPRWRLLVAKRSIGNKNQRRMGRSVESIRTNLKTYSFEYIEREEK